MNTINKWLNKLKTEEINDDLSENKNVESEQLDIDTRNYLRKVFLKNLKKVLILKKEIENNIEKEKEMARQAKIDDITIPVFDGVNFSSWKFRLTNLLEYKECLEPAVREKKDTELEADWKKLDLKAKTIVISAVSDKQLEYINECRTTLEMMKKLEKMYSNKSTTLQIINRNKLDQIKLKNYNNVEDFFVEFEKGCNELKAAGANLTEEEKMRYLIKALPQDYCYIGDFIDLVPEEQRTVDLIKSKIQEKNMNKSEVEKRPNASTFNVKTGQCYQCGKNGHHIKDCWHTKQNQGRGERSSSRGQRGSSRGYNRGRGYGRGRGSSNHRAASNEQYKDTPHEAWATQVVKVNVNKLSENKNPNPKVIEWLLDSGCTHHIVNNKKYFSSVKDLEDPVDVILPDDKVLKATKIGVVKTIFKTYYNEVEIYLENVFLVEGMKRNLLSFSKITENNTIVARKNYAKIYNKYRKLTAVATKIDGLYYMESFCNDLNNNISANVIKLTDKEKWHRALGHVNFQYLNKLVSDKLVEGLPEKLENNEMKCSNCLQSKMANVPFENKRTKTKEILELIHTDLNGPHNTVGYGGERYFLTFIDDYSKCTKIYCIKSKAETASCFIEFVNLVENQFNKRIKKVQCDNGKEYLNKEIYNFAKYKGIEILPCPPYVHELNGVAERYNRSAMDIGRCLAREAKINDRYWPEIMKTVAYLKNRTIANTKENKTPYEIFFGKKPNVSHLKIYGSKVFVRKPEVLRKNKWDNKAEVGILVGYNNNSYRILINNKIINARHVKVIENESELICSEMNDDEINLRLNIQNEDENVNNNSSSTPTLELCRDDQTSEKKAENENRENLTVQRKSQRKKSPVNRYGNPITYSISVNHINVCVPNTFEEAIDCDESKNWIDAMNKEIESINENKTWVLVDRVEGKPVINSKWIYTRKANGRYKARLVIRGFQQKNVIDDIYSPVASNQAIKFLFSFCCQNGLIMEVIDVDSAFLYGDIIAEVYVDQPKGYEDGTNRVCKLLKSMYGLSESPRDWYKCFNEYVESLGFRRSKVELCLYSHGKGDDIVYLLNYVDDVLMCSKNKGKLQVIKRLLAKRFKIKDLGEVKEYLGMKIDYDYVNNKMELSQTKYIESLAEKYDIESGKWYDTPMETKLKLEKSDISEQNIQYRNLLGALLYISSSTRPDISFSVNYLSRFQNCYNKTHFKYALRILKYLYLTKELKLCYKKNTNCEILDCYVDADWGGDSSDRKSTTGYVIRLYGNVIYWKSRKQKCVTRASTFAEYVALAEAVNEIKYIKKLMEVFKINEKNPTKMYEDNSGAIDIAKYGNFTKNSKHIEIQYHYVNESVKANEIEVCKVDSENNIADTLTKALCKATFEKFRELMNIS